MGRYVDGANADVHLDLKLGALGLIRDVPDGVERAPEVAERLLARAAPKRRGGGALVVWNRARKLVASLEMLCKLHCYHLKPAGPGSFEPPADPRMTPGAPGRRRAVI